MALDFMVCHKIQVQNAKCFIQIQLHAVFNDVTNAKSENVEQKQPNFISFSEFLLRF